MKHINITNFEGSITDWTKLNYIDGGMKDDVASLANQTGNKLSKDENGDWQIKDSNGDVIWPTPPTPGPAIVDTYTTTDFSTDWDTTIIGSGTCSIETVSNGIQILNSKISNYVEAVSKFKISDIDNIDVNIYAKNKSHNMFNIFYSEDAENWNLYDIAVATQDETNETVSMGTNVDGPVYLKIILRNDSTRTSWGELHLNSISINL